jgi:hypothetical protein
VRLVDGLLPVLQRSDAVPSDRTQETSRVCCWTPQDASAAGHSSARHSYRQLAVSVAARLAIGLGPEPFPMHRASAAVRPSEFLQATSLVSEPRLPHAPADCFHAVTVHE